MYLKHVDIDGVKDAASKAIQAWSVAEQLATNGTPDEFAKASKDAAARMRTGGIHALPFTIEQMASACINSQRKPPADFIAWVRTEIGKLANGRITPSINMQKLFKSASPGNFFLPTIPHLFIVPGDPEFSNAAARYLPEYKLGLAKFKDLPSFHTVSELRQTLVALENRKPPGILGLSIKAATAWLQGAKDGAIEDNHINLLTGLGFALSEAANARYANDTLLLSRLCHAAALSDSPRGQYLRNTLSLTELLSSDQALKALPQPSLFTARISTLSKSLNQYFEATSDTGALVVKNNFNELVKTSRESKDLVSLINHSMALFEMSKSNPSTKYTVFSIINGLPGHVETYDVRAIEEEARKWDKAIDSLTKTHAKEAQESATTVTETPSDWEVFEFFSQECAEVCVEIKLLCGRLSNASTIELEDAKNLRRHFHTIKGSSRMAGLEHIGEGAWKIEEVMNALIEAQKPFPPYLIANANEAASIIQTIVEEIAETKRGRPLNLEYLCSLAQRTVVPLKPADPTQKIHARQSADTLQSNYRPDDVKPIMLKLSEINRTLTAETTAFSKLLKELGDIQLHLDEIQRQAKENKELAYSVHSSGIQFNASLIPSVTDDMAAISRVGRVINTIISSMKNGALSS